jgi:hypothetical protein
MSWQLKKNNELFINQEALLKKEEENIRFIDLFKLINEIS